MHPEFNLSLVASEPLINKVMAIDWDEKGRLWVAETPEYPNGRRAPNTTVWKDTGSLRPGQTQREPEDRISILTDTDGDGIENNADPDIDGDGIINANDPDIDGDGIPNAQDSDPAATNGLIKTTPTTAPAYILPGLIPVEFEIPAGRITLVALILGFGAVVIWLRRKRK